MRLPDTVAMKRILAVCGVSLLCSDLTAHGCFQPALSSAASAGQNCLGNGNEASRYCSNEENSRCLWCEFAMFRPFKLWPIAEQFRNRSRLGSGSVGRRRCGRYGTDSESGFTLHPKAGDG